MKKLIQIAQDAVYFFAMSCVLFIPFPFHIFSSQAHITQFIWGKAISFTGQQVFGIQSVNAEISSDSTNMYLLVFLLGITALLFAIISALIRIWTKKRLDILAIIRQILCYYLALMMFKYGFDKVFKAQFYLPEPNTLYTPMGHLSKDILFWSTMGTSYSYSVFGGVIEVMAGGLILFKRTRVLGLLLIIGVMLNVVAINFGFDISVKLYSLLLLLLALILLAPQTVRMYEFFILQKESRLRVVPEAMPAFFNKKLRLLAQILLIGFLLLEALYPYLITGNFNDDKFPRPYLHGAYEVRGVLLDNQTVALNTSPVRRFFIHLKGFMIFQNFEDQMQDYKLEVNQIQKKLTLTNYQSQKKYFQYTYLPKDSLLTLRFTEQKQRITLKAKVLNWRDLPTTKSQFHWTIEAVK